MNHGVRREMAQVTAKAPQKKSSTAAAVTTLSATCKPSKLPRPPSAASNKTLVHCRARYRLGACPRSTSCASQALYTWLPRSPASRRRCQKQGVSMAAEMASNRSQWARANRAAADQGELSGHEACGARCGSFSTGVTGASCLRTHDVKDVSNRRGRTAKRSLSRIISGNSLCAGCKYSPHPRLPESCLRLRHARCVIRATRGE
jgi:hypothetical protein